MGEYKLLCIVLFTLIIGSKTWPDKARETNNQQAKGSKAATTRHVDTDDDDGITFPDDDAILVRKDFIAEGKGLNCTEDICDKAADYPYDHIKQIVSRLPDLPNLFGEFVGNIVNSGNRVKADDPEWNYLCETTVHTGYPQTMKNHKNITKFIVNDEKYKQGVIYEKCVSDKCAKDASFPVGVEAKCIQKYSQVRLLAIEPNKEGNAAQDTFIVPSCCVCAFTKPKL